MSFFMSEAFAVATTSGGASTAAQADSFSFIMIGAIFLLGYLMLIRPQSKKAKEHRQLISGLKKGDEVITSGGILAKVISIDEQYIKISPAEGVEMNVQKGAVATVLPKGTLKSL